MLTMKMENRGLICDYNQSLYEIQYGTWKPIYFSVPYGTPDYTVTSIAEDVMRNVMWHPHWFDKDLLKVTLSNRDYYHWKPQ